MDNMLTLQAGGQKFDIPVLEFIAGWFAMCNYSSPDEIEVNVDAAWCTQPLPLLKQRFGIDGPFVVCSVEALCNILCDDAYIADWQLRDDTDFLLRNNTVIKTCDADSAILHEAVITKWGATGPELRDSILRRVDALILPVVYASGLSQD